MGHRISVDIDLFSDVEYGSLDFHSKERFLKNQFPFIDHLSSFPFGFGKSYFVGENKENAVKLDLYYTDRFINPVKTENGIRLATIEEITAMKIDVIQRIGRKKRLLGLT